MQACLQTAFERWGLPEAIRFDNGKPWRNPLLRVPTSLALWLVGLGIQPHFGRPRQSTDNAVVERCHGVMSNWVEPETCHDLNELTQRLTYFAEVQREQYPVKDNCSRLQAFPELTQPASRPYSHQQDQSLWQPHRIYHYLARFTFSRRVEKNGRITLLTHEYSLGRQYRAQQVNVRLDTGCGHWVVKDRDGQVVKTFPAQQLSYDTIAGMKLNYANFRANRHGA